MAKKCQKHRLGIIFDYNSNWMGGTYYILNLLHAISELPAEKQPDIVIYGEDVEGFEIIKNQIEIRGISYKKITNIQSNKLIVGINFIYRALFGVNLFKKGPSDKNEVIFPNPRGLFFQEAPHKVFWIPDFQEKYYPGFFSEKDLDFRECFNQNMIEHKFPVVFSSNDAHNDFKEFYPRASNTAYIIPFAVTIPDYSSVDVDNLRNQFALNEPFFITPNQFWMHKNHAVIIEAAALLKKKGIRFKVLFSGKDYDPRCPEYTSQLKDQISKHDLDDTVVFLGFLERKVLLSLIRHSAAVIQPSLFEGWSTVIEDAKALDKPVIASSLNVHKEQLGDRCRYFDPRNSEALAVEMVHQLESGISEYNWHYEDTKYKFADKFMHMIEEVKKN